MEVDTAADVGTTKKPFKRLSKAVQATNYIIRLHPNLETFTCEGRETIDVEVKREVNRWNTYIFRNEWYEGVLIAVLFFIA